MKLNTTFEENICTITVEGSIDALTSPELEQEAVAAAQQCEKMIIDMNGVDYIAFTAGIGENSGFVRAKVMQYLGYLGVKPDP